MFQITNKWLVDHSTRGCGFTKKQLDAIGISWPPQKGWKESVIGKWITEEEAAIFEKRKPKKRPQEEIEIQAIQTLKNIINRKIHCFTDEEVMSIKGCFSTIGNECKVEKTLKRMQEKAKAKANKR